MVRMLVQRGNSWPGVAVLLAALLCSLNPAGAIFAADPSTNHATAAPTPPRSGVAETHLAGRRPNIILIMPDDQGYGDLACHGNPWVKTPHLDRLYRESVRLVDFHVSPTCSPTRAALLTGRHEFYSGVSHTIAERERLSLDAVTLPSVLHAAGYATGIFGKWHLGDEAPYQPEQRGFDEVFIHGGGGIGQSFPGSCGDAPGNRYFNPVIRHNGQFEATAGYCTDVFFAAAWHWIAQVAGQQPFFCYITPNAPHDPLDCPVGSDEPYRGHVPDDVAKFYGMITNIDDNLGRLLADLSERGLERDTLVIFLTDNGSATGAKVFNAGMRGAKASPDTGGTRVPSFWRWPGTLTGGTDVQPLTCHWDILPTLIEIAGVSPDSLLRQQIRGRSVCPLLVDREADWPERDFFVHLGRWPAGKLEESRFSSASMRRGEWHLVFRDATRRELYDVRRDPGERTNLADQYPAMVTEMTQSYVAWWNEVTPGLVNEQSRGPAMNPFHAAYWKQFAGPGPNGIAPPAGFLAH